LFREEWEEWEEWEDWEDWEAWEDKWPNAGSNVNRFF